MPVNCDPSNAGTYATKHNPAVYYKTLGAGCKASDVPLEGGTDSARPRARSVAGARGDRPEYPRRHAFVSDLDRGRMAPVVGRADCVDACVRGRSSRRLITWDEGEVHGVVPGENCAQISVMRAATSQCSY
jgi:hypothetical protein